MSQEVDKARASWEAASEEASKLSATLFQPGSGYGDPDARKDDEQRLISVRHEAEIRYREFQDLDRRDLDLKMLALQRSQRSATWASFAVALVVGVATIVNILITFFPQQ